MNREILKKLVSLTCTLAKQELTFRGHDESNDSLNAINNFSFFACILDETTDITERAQSSIVCRLVDTKCVVQEYFLGFFYLGEDQSAPALRDLLLSVIAKFDCEAKLIAQTYDGASVMSGQLNGLQKLVRDSAPLAIFTHCLAHRLNLVLQQSCSNITTVKIFFSTLQGIPAYFHQSSKRSYFLNKILGKRIPTNSEVRWNSNAKVVYAVSQERKKLLQVFQDIMNCPESNAKSIRQTDGFKLIYFNKLSSYTTSCRRKIMLEQLEQRFSDYKKFQFLELGDNRRFTEYGAKFPQKALDSLMDTYEPLFNKSLLKTELEMIFSAIHRENFHDKSLLELIKSMFDNEINELLPESYKLFCLLATIPATSALVERTFSTLKRIKSERYSCSVNGNGRHIL
ncbi:uncharacterized protein [Diabrotica undecimpunctata]|uniref:uncharacterized protein n=1 Tax=Diabrotica undecimpunctata TaxID=50387 RepID=UPI003B6428F6